LAESELYDPKKDRWTRAASLPVARWWPIRAALSDGRVLIAGGSLDNKALQDSYIYDPRRDVWEETGSLDAKRDAGVALSAGGDVLIAGGYDSGNFEPRVERYDPSLELASNPRKLGFELADPVPADLALVDQLLQLALDRIEPLLEPGCSRLAC